MLCLNHGNFYHSAHYIPDVIFNLKENILKQLINETNIIFICQIFMFS